MDSKNICIATSHMKSKIDWEMTSGNEWSFVGDGSDFKENKVNDFICSFFKENELYLVIDRHNAFSVSKNEAGTKIKELLKKQNITLCNNTFTQMIEFSYIGVVKHGVL